MSISTLENRDSQRLIDNLAALNERYKHAEAAAIRDFKEACSRGDAGAYAHFAPMVTDWRNAKPGATSEKAPRREQTVSEVMFDSLDTHNGPQLHDLMKLLMDAANGMDVKDQAQNLIERMAAAWAHAHVEVE